MISELLNLKPYLLVASLICCRYASAQSSLYEMSTNGLDSIKIGMSKPDVERQLKTKLVPYVLDTIKIRQELQRDSIPADLECKNCREYYTCEYKNITLVLGFFRFTLYKQTDFELIQISPNPPSALIHTRSGIKIGISEKKFLAICKKNNFHFSAMTRDQKNKSYFFSDNQNTNSSKMLLLNFSDQVLTSMMAVNMIGD